MLPRLLKAVFILITCAAWPFYAWAGPLAASVGDSAIVFKRGHVQVTILAGNIMEQKAHAAAFPSSVKGGGDELIVGSLLREAGAEKGFLELERLFRDNTYESGSVQIVEAGGGRFEYIINATTQNFERLDLPESERGAIASIKGHAREQQLIAKTVTNLLLEISKADSPIHSVALPMFGTGSFHGMHPFLSLIAMLSGIERYVEEFDSGKALRISIVWYGRPGEEATKFFRDKVLPAIELGLQQPSEFARFTQAQWDEPMKTMSDFKTRLLAQDPATPAASAQNCENKLAPSTANRQPPKSSLRRLFDFLRPKN